MVIRPVAITLLVGLALCARSDSAEPYVLWIDRAAARPWLPALTYAAERTNLPVALVAELIGNESGFKNVRNKHSSASGFGQQIDHNAIMLTNHLDKRVPSQSILGAALELRARLDRTHNLGDALRGYGTTTGMSAARRRDLEAHFAQASVRRYPLINTAQNTQNAISAPIAANTSASAIMVSAPPHSGS